MKQLWTVTVDAELMVAAETKEQAEKIARDNRRDIVEWNCFASKAEHVAHAWDADCVPYGEDEKTVGEYLAERAVPLAGEEPK